jgi:Cdc6-like AAA superfamily ATPase/ribosomal protein L13E
MTTPRRLRGGVVKRRPLTPARFLNPPKKSGCSKCRQKGCRSCRGYTLKELARWQEEQGNGRDGHGVEPKAVDAEIKRGIVDVDMNAIANGDDDDGETKAEDPVMVSTTARPEAKVTMMSTRTRTRGKAARTDGATSGSGKRPLTPERFINPPSKIGCSKCRHKGCKRCRGYTLDELKRWQEERGQGVDAQTIDDSKFGDDKDKCTAPCDSKTPAMAKDRAERVDDLSPAELDKPVRGTMAIAESETSREEQKTGVVASVVDPVSSAWGKSLAETGPREEPLVAKGVSKQNGTTALAKASVGNATIKPAVVIQEKIERASPGDRDENWWNPLDQAIVRKAKGCLHVSYTGMVGLPSCRDKQIHEMSDWLNYCVQNTRGDSLYLSGVPGTGKTLAANAIIRSAIAGMRDSPLPPPVALSINCMRVETAKDVLSRIVAGFRTAALQTITGRLDDDPLVRVPENDDGIVLDGAWADLSPEEHLQKIVHHPIMTKEQLEIASSGKKRRSSVTESDLVKQTGLIFLILDEIDGMLSGRNCEEIMGSLLALASSEGSRLIIIGIANSIDLMQQLTRPGAVFHRFNLKPKNIIFPTYLREQVSQLLQERLDALPGPVIDPKAIQFCARKIANGTGDMRRALEAASLSIDIAVKDAMVSSENVPNLVTKQNAETAGPAAMGAAVSSPVDRVKRIVGMRQMGMALNKLSGGVGSSNEHVQAIRKLPVPQQLIMCTLSAMVGESFKARGIEDRPNGMKDGHPLLGMKISHNFVSLPTYRAPDAVAVPKAGVQMVTLADIEQGQRSLCTSVGVEKYTPSEFSTAIEVLETMGLIQLSGKKATDMKRSRVQLKISEDDVWLALSDIPILKNILTKK